MAKLSLYSFSAIVYNALEDKFSVVFQVHGLPGIRTGYPLSIQIVTQRFSSMVDTCSNVDLKTILILVLSLRQYYKDFFHCYQHILRLQHITLNFHQVKKQNQN